CDDAGSKDPRPDAESFQARTAHYGTDRGHTRSDRTGANDAGLSAKNVDQVAGRWSAQMPDAQQFVRRANRQGAAQRRQSRRGGRNRGADPGRRAQGRGQGRTAPGSHATGGHATGSRDRDHGGSDTPLIPRNTTIPTCMSEVLSTAADGQTSGKVHVLQGASNGRREQIARVLHLWTLPAPRGVPQVLV